jgi:hypothetical protein
MIVLDEQLLGLHLELEIANWYRGKVSFITELRPNSVIKDEAIPHLLRQQLQPTFVTINEQDFWRKVLIDRQYCIVCFVVPNSRAREIPRLLRALFGQVEFETKTKRMGKIIRVTRQEVCYYSFDEKIKTIKWFL